ncbi:UNVERIFIED_CONTAM: hypothetical protein RMT77_014785 [Armadillidium vulgare]
MDRLDFLTEVDKVFEQSLKDEEKWHKTLNSSSKFNLNSEVREKSSLNKNIFKLKEKKKNGHYNGSKPQDFINNRFESGHPLKKNTNEGGIGRGAGFQRRMENIRPGFSVRQSFLRDHPVDNSLDLLSAPITYQMDKMMGDVYSDVAIRRSLNDISRRGVALSDEDESCSGSLERAFSEVSLTSTSTLASPASNLSNGSGPSPQDSDWIPDEFHYGPSHTYFNDHFPSLK